MTNTTTGEEFTHRISEWHVAPGAKVEAGDVFCEYSIDPKIEASFDCQDDCIVADVLVPEAMFLQSGTPVLVTVATQEELVAYQVRMCVS
eukprot:COSAG06_NODE_333_length_17341_cov_7.601032_2_plen_90_part_00